MISDADTIVSITHSIYAYKKKRYNLEDKEQIVGLTPLVSFKYSRLSTGSCFFNVDFMTRNSSSIILIIFLAAVKEKAKTFILNKLSSIYARSQRF